MTRPRTTRDSHEQTAASERAATKSRPGVRSVSVPERGQTTMDFAAGVSVFLVTVAFAFTFVPGIVEPFDGDGVADPATATRVADMLATDRLASPDEPYELNETAVDEFFDEPPPVEDRLPVQNTDSVRVVLENETGTIREAGDAIPEDASATVVWHVVTYEGERAELVVRVW